jgi:hypothetical protein
VIGSAIAWAPRTSKSLASQPLRTRSAKVVGLPKDHGVEALAAYAVAQDAHLVLVSESLDSIDELRPLLAATEGVDGVPRPAIELHVVALADAGMPPSDTSDPGAKVS